MFNREETKKHAGYAKTEIKFAIQHLENGDDDIEYITSMLYEALKQIDVIMEHN